MDNQYTINNNIASSLSQDEKELFSILKDVVYKFYPSTKIYAVGGWTRDKLMGQEPNDIDIMVSNVSGEEFAKTLSKYLNIKDPHVIKENPDKSKHITTAKAYIPLSSGIREIDFAQARKEVYTEDSRVPIIKDATPEEDAYRRDLTINSIFYDIVNNQIIDFTGRGIKDLASKTITTPLDPVKTFMDDPLRVFRAIRFSSRYNWNIDPQTIEAMRNPVIQNEIKKKVSKERIGEELKKTLSGPNPQHAISILKDTGLLQNIINEATLGSKYEGKLKPLDMEQNNPHHQLTVWGHTFQTISNLLSNNEMDGEARATMTLAALMHDLGKTYEGIQAQKENGTTSYHGHEQESEELVRIILKYLKMEPYIDQVSKLVGQHMKLHGFINQGGVPQKTLRRFIRKMTELSVKWIDVFNLTLADALSKDTNIDQKTVETYNNLKNQLIQAESSMMVNQISSPNIKPVLNGNEIMSILGVKEGKIVGEAIAYIKDLMDEDPNINKEEAANKITEKFTNQISKIKQEKQAKQAKVKTSKSVNASCSEQYINQKKLDIEELIKNKNFYEAATKAIEVIDEFDETNDDRIPRLAAGTLFYILRDSGEINFVLYSYISEKLKKSSFDPILCGYHMTIIIMAKIFKDNNNIIDMYKNQIDSNKSIIKKIFSKLPEKTKQENADIMRIVGL